MRSVFFLILSLLFLSTFLTSAGDRDLPKELGVLEKFIGTWDQVVTLKHPGGGKDSIQKAESKRSWSLGGSYLRIEEVNWARPDYDEFQMLLTYDVLEKIHTGVIIDGADVQTVTASWDGATNSMSFDAKGSAGNLKHTIRFVNENQAEGSGTFTNAEGKVVAEVTWQQTRRTEPQK